LFTEPPTTTSPIAYSKIIEELIALDPPAENNS
jgi:hypothetical protein